MKFGVSFATTTPLPSTRSPNAATRSITAGSVSPVGTSSSSGRYRGGLKKWVPSQRRRRSIGQPSAMAPTGMPEVFVVSTASGPQTAATLSSSPRFTSIRSTTASSTQSASASSARSASKPPVRTRVQVSGVNCGSGLSARARSRPARAASRETSSSTTGTPALARCRAICAPMVPAPRTAARVNVMPRLRPGVCGRPRRAGTDR